MGKFLAALTILSAIAASQAATLVPKPNIILILADDLGFSFPSRVGPHLLNKQRPAGTVPTFGNRPAHFTTHTRSCPHGLMLPFEKMR